MKARNRKAKYPNCFAQDLDATCELEKLLEI